MTQFPLFPTIQIPKDGLLSRVLVSKSSASHQTLSLSAPRLPRALCPALLSSGHSISWPPAAPGSQGGRESPSRPESDPEPGGRLCPARSAPDSFWRPGTGGSNSNSSHSRTCGRAHRSMARNPLRSPRFRAGGSAAPHKHGRGRCTTWADGRPAQRWPRATPPPRPQARACGRVSLGGRRRDFSPAPGPRRAVSHSFVWNRTVELAPSCRQM